MDDLIASAWAGEEALLTSAVRGNPQRIAALLADDFYEIGQSGRRWSRNEIFAVLANGTAPAAASTLTEREQRRVGTETVLLSYRLNYATRLSHRSSLWRREDGAVRCFFHQGTVISA